MFINIQLVTLRNRKSRTSENNFVEDGKFEQFKEYAIEKKARALLINE